MFAKRNDSWFSENFFEFIQMKIERAFKYVLFGLHATWSFQSCSKLLTCKMWNEETKLMKSLLSILLIKIR